MKKPSRYVQSWEDNSMLQLIFESFSRPHELIERRKELKNLFQYDDFEAPVVVHHKIEVIK